MHLAVVPRNSVVALAPPRPTSVALGIAGIGELTFIATVVPLSAAPETGYGPFLSYGLLLAAVSFGLITLLSSRVEGTAEDVRIFGVLTERRIPISRFTSVDALNGLFVSTDERAYGCVGYGPSLAQEFLHSKRYARAGDTIERWASARLSDERTEDRPRPHVFPRRWLLVGPFICVPAALAYTTVLWAFAAPIRAALWPSP